MASTGTECSGACVGIFPVELRVWLNHSGHSFAGALTCNFNFLYRAYGSGKEDSPFCDVIGFETARMKLLRHVSFVDCPVSLSRLKLQWFQMLHYCSLITSVSVFSLGKQRKGQFRISRWCIHATTLYTSFILFLFCRVMIFSWLLCLMVLLSWMGHCF